MDDLSISFHMGRFDPALIRRAAGQGFNDVTFQTEGGANHGLLVDLDRRARAAGVPDLLASLGMSATAWVHEFDDRREGLGPIDLANDRLWDDLAARYRRIFTDTCPWLDRLVLTVSETSVNCTEEALLRKTVGVIHAVCRKHGKRLILRTFVHDPDELGQVAASLVGLPPEVAVMTKMVPQDWTLTDQPDPLIGKVGDRPQVVELDICGEYWRGDLIPHFKGPWLAEHFARWREAGCVGLSVRVDRRQRPGAWWQPQTRDYFLAGQPQEADLDALARLARGETDAVSAAALAWARPLCRDDASAARLAAALPVTGEALRVATILRGYPFSITWNRVPGEWTMNRAHGPKAESRARAYADEDDAEHRSPWHVKPSPMRWDASRWSEYHQLRRGAEPFLEEKEADLERVLSGLRAARAALDEIDWADGAARTFHTFMFEEMSAYTEAAALCQCFWLAASRWLYAETPDVRDTARQQALAFDERLAALGPRAGAVLDLDYAGRHWKQYGFQHLDVHGFRAWCRSYWYGLFEDPLLSVPIPEPSPCIREN
ncbi:MAG: hypothetical protein ACLFTU_07520 [Puniceicoccaceae bacterium]